MTDKELIIKQKRTLAERIFDAFTGNIFALSAEIPSLVTLVAQKVLVRIVKTRITIKARPKPNLILNAL